MKTGDTLRLRRFGSMDDWCTGVVRICNQDETAFAVLVKDGALKTEGGIMMGAICVSVISDSYSRDRAFEILTGTELEIEGE